jgi:outer membrane immunogenic protein
MKRTVLVALYASVALAAPAMAQDTFNWTGFHAGINLGYTNANYHLPFSGNLQLAHASYVLNTDIRYAQSGFIGGGQFGYDYLLAGGWLVGLETDAQAISAGVDLHATGLLNASTAFSIRQQTNIDFLNTFRARMGYVLPQNMLVYGTAGLAYGGVTTTHNLTSTGGADNVGSNFDRFDIDFGWTIGGGIEYPLSDRISVRTEYLYADLGTRTFLNGTLSIPSPTIISGAADYRQSTRAHVVRFAINYTL